MLGVSTVPPGFCPSEDEGVFVAGEQIMAAKRKTTRPPPPPPTVHATVNVQQLMSPAARAQRLAAALAAKGWSNAELARRSGSTPNTIGNMVRGTGNVYEKTLKGACRALDVSVAHIMYGAPLAPYDDDEMADLPRKAPNAGVQKWLANSKLGKHATQAEREWLYAMPWPSDVVREPDAAYEYALHAFRALRSTSGK